MPRACSRLAIGAREEGQDFAGGGFLAGGSGQRQARLDLGTVAAAVFLLDHVAGCGQAADDAAGAGPQAQRPLMPGLPGLAGMPRSYAAGDRTMPNGARARLARNPARYLKTSHRF
jgi:hypothetical protein